MIETQKNSVDSLEINEETKECQGGCENHGNIVMKCDVIDKNYKKREKFLCGNAIKRYRDDGYIVDVLSHYGTWKRV